MINGKRYLIVKKQENGCYPIKLAYWFDKRVTKYRIYVDGFYRSEHFYYPHKNIIAFDLFIFSFKNLKLNKFVKFIS